VSPPVTIRQLDPKPATFGPFEGSSVSIGKHPDCDVALISPRVNRRHAILDWHEGVLRVTDLSSIAGVLRNGVRIQPNEPVPLAPGDELTLGDRRLVVDWTDL
jgi:pSer/pThr/pTyr-binding forkhead associated (FHA) protein